MCKECVEINGKIERYDLLASRVSDRSLREGLEDLIDRLEALKVALHPDQAKPRRLRTTVPHLLQ